MKGHTLGCGTGKGRQGPGHAILDHWCLHSGWRIDRTPAYGPLPWRRVCGCADCLCRLQAETQTSIMTVEVHLGKEIKRDKQQTDARGHLGML